MEVGPGTRKMKACVFLVFSVKMFLEKTVRYFDSWDYSFQLELVLISWELRICLRQCFRIFPFLLLQFQISVTICIFILCNCVKDTENPLPTFLKCRRKCLQILQHLKLYIPSLPKQKPTHLVGKITSCVDQLLEFPLSLESLRFW